MNIILEELWKVKGNESFLYVMSSLTSSWLSIKNFIVKNAETIEGQNKKLELKVVPSVTEPKEGSKGWKGQKLKNLAGAVREEIFFWSNRLVRVYSECSYLNYSTR